ncbi:heme-binding protein soul2 [Cyclopterus lumpus]|uniref:heme-binding protein soul2 n=1 Tax=Cyclopterus lumpus TaxID=8103 RepID=UPI001486D799|nr:heme-binding protein soul2 [Cyclopterus lumpus]
MDLPLLALVLVSACGGRVWTAPDYCSTECPQYTVVEKHKDFEERLYASAQWITTKMAGTVISDLMAASSRLAKVATGADWPVLISLTNDSECWYSWFVPRDMTESQITDPSVKLWRRPEVSVYVRVFDGTPSIKSGRDNAKILYDDLKKAERSVADANAYTWAGYNTYLSLTHHNEIWMEKSQ